MTAEQYETHQARVKGSRVAVKRDPGRDRLAGVQAPKKYKNRPTGGYSSVKEAKRAQELKLLQDAGQIRGLREQVRFELIPKQGMERACAYVADFCYAEFVPDTAERFNGWTEVVEDVKSPATRTAEYVIKRKLMLKVHGIRIRET